MNSRTRLCGRHRKRRFETNAIEVTQAIQDRDNTLPLVADKRTVARLYADVNGVGSVQPSIVYLYSSSGGNDLPGSPLATTGMTAYVA